MDINNIKELIILNFDIVWLQIVLLFLGIILIIIALFRPKDNQFIEEKIENIFENFITQIDIENEEIIKKIKQTQSQFPIHLSNNIEKLEERINRLEQAKTGQASIAASVETILPVNQGHKFEQVLNLYNAGEDVDSIAKKTKMGHAEIKLILELSKKGFKYV